MVAAAAVAVQEKEIDKKKISSKFGKPFEKCHSRVVTL